MHDPFHPPYKSMLLPAEWEAQSAVWFTWPQNADTWTPVWEDARLAYKEILRASLRYQDVNLLVNDRDLRGRLGEELGAMASQAPFRLEILEYPTNDSWIRDYGALTVRVPDGAKTRLVALDFTFNSWGGKYPPWDKDDAAPLFMAGHRGREAFSVDLVLEGGSIDVNGRGKLLTTTQCLLNPNRNPKLGRDRIERALHDWLGIEETLWLESGINGDDTDGHVDDLARFTDARTVFCAIETDSRDENYEPLKRNIRALERYSRTMDLEVVEVPMPARQVKADLRTPATYLNFLILNGAVLVPVFRDKRDDGTLQLFEKHFPGRRIEPIDCRSLVFGQGAIHCSSMQEPAETPATEKEKGPSAGTAG
ncbi:MAG TPA: agmatine deiminase family protein [Fibrobacteria bacterium]|nr:agmatine deiminase family protein [Fibrobacteria bacterium]